jgi:hypothetical protein
MTRSWNAPRAFSSSGPDGAERMQVRETGQRRTRALNDARMLRIRALEAQVWTVELAQRNLVVRAQVDAER